MPSLFFLIQPTPETAIPIYVSMQQSPSIPMETTGKIIRRSIYTFLKNYQYFTSTATLYLLPVSASILLSQAVVSSSSSLQPTIQARLQSLFNAAGFPPSSQFFSLLNLKLSQTISSSVLTLPFTLSFLLIAKASIIHALHHHKPAAPHSFSSFISLYNSLLVTHLCNSFVILSANATAFSLFFLAFNTLDALGFCAVYTLLILSAAGAVLYSVLLANTLIICNLALVVAGMENCSGYLAILKACVLVRGRASTALSLALPANLALAFVEALFQFRVVRVFSLSDRISPSVASEGLLIAYLYSLIILFDIIASCIFFKSCKSGSRMNRDSRYVYPTEIAEKDDNSSFTYSKDLQEFP